MKSNVLKITKWIFISPAILVLLAVAFCEINKAYWDHQVKLMCEKDGGVTVYERVELTKEEYEKNDGENGAIRVPPETSSVTDKYDYASKNVMYELHKSNPNVWRMDGVVYRKFDRKQLGKMVTYSRVGGDFPMGFHSSSFSCGDIKGMKLDVEKQVLTFKGE